MLAAPEGRVSAFGRPGGTGLITEALAVLTAEQVVQRLEQAQIANANVSTMADVWAHPQLQARDRWVDIGTSAAVIPALLPPGMPSSFEPRMDPVPALGEHSDAILGELGYAVDSIAALRAQGAI